MSDKREDILTRLFEVLESITGITTVARNRGELPVDLRPAILMLDCDEEADERARDRGRISAAPNMVVLSPEIYISLQHAKPQNEDVGQNLNYFRSLILKAVLTDSELKSLVGSNGEVWYGGCVTDLARGRAMEGEMGLILRIRYVLNPNEL